MSTPAASAVPATPFSGNFLRLKEVCTLLKCGKSTIYNRRDPKSSQYDPSFPRSIRLGSRLAVWRENELRAWVESRPRTQHHSGPTGDSGA
jgi:prophage regulatory protein